MSSSGNEMRAVEPRLAALEAHQTEQPAERCLPAPVTMAAFTSGSAWGGGEIDGLQITGNTITFVNGDEAGHAEGGYFSSGINYNQVFSSSALNLTSNLFICYNSITDALAEGIYINAPLDTAEIVENVINNPGGSPSASQWNGWQGGVFVRGDANNLQSSLDTILLECLSC